MHYIQVDVSLVHVNVCSTVITLLLLYAVDERCDMELDETDPAVWSKLETATQEYVDANAAVFQAACNALAPISQKDGVWLDKSRSSRGGPRGSQLGKGTLLYRSDVYQILNPTP